MAKYVCQVCGYVYEGDAAPAECPICHAPASKFTKQEEGKTWAAEHVVGVATVSYTHLWFLWYSAPWSAVPWPSVTRKRWELWV